MDYPLIWICESRTNITVIFFFLISLFRAKNFKLPHGESIIFHSPVEEHTMRRRASKLIPLVSQGKTRSRQLVLTSKRLLCLKERQKGFSVKFELSLKAPGQLKEKEFKGIIASAQRKGENEFVILTVGTLCSLCVSLFDVRLILFRPRKYTISLHRHLIYLSNGSTSSMRPWYHTSVYHPRHGLQYDHTYRITSTILFVNWLMVFQWLLFINVL